MHSLRSKKNPWQQDGRKKAAGPSSPDLEILEAALVTGTDIEGNAEILKRATAEIQRLKNIKFEMSSMTVGSWVGSNGGNFRIRR